MVSVGVNTENRTDAEVISSSWDNLEEFGVIFERHYDAVFAFVARRIYRREAADLTSAVFIKAIDLRRRYDTNRPDALPWLYGIARNVIGDRFRRIRRSDRENFAVVSTWGATDQNSEADDRLVAAGIATELKEGLGRLPASQREALMMSALEGLTYAEISRIQGVSPLTVGSRLTRARRRIREFIPDLAQKADWVVEENRRSGRE